MPLEILLMLVVGGIAGVAGLMHLMGLSRRRSFANADEAKTAWLREYPGLQPQSVDLNEACDAALIRTKRRVGLVWCFGVDTVARPLRNCDIRQRKDGLDVRFGDTGVPSVRLTLTGDEISHWKDVMETP